MELYHSSKFIKKKFWLGMLQIAIGLISLILNRFGPFFQYGWLIIGLLTLTDCYCDWKNYMIKIDINTSCARVVFSPHGVLMLPVLRQVKNT